MADKAWKVFERDMCRNFAAWWFPNKYPMSRKVRAEELPFRRTPNSGAWGGPRKAHSADVIGPKSFPFSVECKRQKAWSWDTVMRGSTTLVDKWWKQTVTTAGKQKKLPLLVFTKPNMPVFVRTTKEVWQSITRTTGQKIPLVCRMGQFVYFRFESLMAVDGTTLKNLHRGGKS